MDLNRACSCLKQLKNHLIKNLVHVQYKMSFLNQFFFIKPKYKIREEPLIIDVIRTTVQLNSQFLTNKRSSDHSGVYRCNQNSKHEIIILFWYNKAANFHDLTHCTYERAVNSLHNSYRIHTSVREFRIKPSDELRTQNFRKMEKNHSYQNNKIYKKISKPTYFKILKETTNKTVYKKNFSQIQQEIKAFYSNLNGNHRIVIGKLEEISFQPKDQLTHRSLSSRTGSLNGNAYFNKLYKKILKYGKQVFPSFTHHSLSNSIFIQYLVIMGIELEEEKGGKDEKIFTIFQVNDKTASLTEDKIFNTLRTFEISGRM